MFLMTGHIFSMLMFFIAAVIVVINVAAALLIYLKLMPYDRMFPAMVVLSCGMIFVVYLVVSWIPCTGYQTIPWMGEIISNAVCVKIGML
jgi:hypothetical protein